MFQARLRRVGNSLGVLLPKKALDELHLGEGDEVEFALLPVASERQKRLKAVMGTVPGLSPFQRDRKDRY